MRNSRGRRYDSQPKLNYKKLFGVIIALIVIIMMITLIVKIIKNPGETKEVTKVSYYSAYTHDKWVVINNKGEVVIDGNNKEMIIVPDSGKDVFIITYDVNEEDGTYKTKVVNAKNEEIFITFEKVEAIENYDTKQNIWYEKALRIEQEGKYGLIDLDGNKILDCEYEEIDSLKGVKGNLLVKKDGKIGLVNDSGQKIIDTIYTDVLALDEGYTNEYIIINEENKQGIITTSGKITIEPQYENIKYVNSSDYYVAKNGESIKLISIKGEEYLDGLYDDISEVKGDNIVVVKGRKVWSS